MRRSENKTNRDSRRAFLKQSTLLLSSAPLYGNASFATFPPSAYAQTETKLHWLGSQAPAASRGVTWGMPWRKAVLQDTEKLLLTVGGKSNSDVQHWVTARWPDGSVKWSAHAAVWVQEGAGSDLVLRATGGIVNSGDRSIRVVENDDSVHVDTGAMQCVFA